MHFQNGRCRWESGVELTWCSVVGVVIAPETTETGILLLLVVLTEAKPSATKRHRGLTQSIVEPGKNGGDAELSSCDGSKLSKNIESTRT